MNQTQILDQLIRKVEELNTLDSVLSEVINPLEDSVVQKYSGLLSSLITGELTNTPQLREIAIFLGEVLEELHYQATELEAQKHRQHVVHQTIDDTIKSLRSDFRYIKKNGT